MNAPSTAPSAASSRPKEPPADLLAGAPGPAPDTGPAPDRSAPGGLRELRSRPVPALPGEGYAPVIPMPPRRRNTALIPEERAMLPGKPGLPPGNPARLVEGQMSAVAIAGKASSDARAGIASQKAAERAREEAILVRNMAAKIGQASVEVLAGTRPIQQLARWLDPRSFDALLVRAALTRTVKEAGRNNVRQLHRNPTVRSVHCSAVAPGIYESCLVVSEQVRQRALAMRLEQNHGVWKVTALEIG